MSTIEELRIATRLGLQSLGTHYHFSQRKSTGKASMELNEQMMCPQLVHTTKQSHAHDLELIQKTTHSLLAYHRPHLQDGAALRILDLAILNAIADLEQIDTCRSNGGFAVR